MRIRLMLPMVWTLCWCGATVANDVPKGLGKALQASGRANGANSAGLQRAGQKIPQVGKELSRTGSALGRAGQGLHLRPPALPSQASGSNAASTVPHKHSAATPPESGSPTTLPSGVPFAGPTNGRNDVPDHLRDVSQRNHEHRLDQAEQLRQLGERNGNERLGQTADRIEAQAERQFDRRTENIDPRFSNPPAVSAEPTPRTTGTHRATDSSQPPDATGLRNRPNPPPQNQTPPPSKPWWKRVFGGQ